MSGVIPEAERIDALRAFGLSSGLIALASGKLTHPLFEISCLGPAYYSYHDAHCPPGPLLVPLWDHCDSVAGVWRRLDGLEFIEFSIEGPPEYKSLARTEQGFWATRFDFLWESDAEVSALREAAVVVGFQFLDRFLRARQEAEATDQFRTFEGHGLWLNELVAHIDSAAKTASSRST